jgi:hypothetical protein
MARRLQQTLADYLVIAISPALIMLLVGSLMFFLLRVFYQGEFQERLHWVMTCFVFAAVLIARISIEDGFERAAPFGAALAILVGIAANRFMEYHGSWIDSYSWVINFTVIGIVWWCVHQLTWDCTVIDESEDASGEGLMQIVGLEGPADARNAVADAERLSGTTTREVPAGFWQRYLERQRRPHAPGVWVVYFSLAALPIFGLGQWLIPVANAAGRRYVFWLLCIYVASGLGLLLTTSFLGLRRYLRQRRIEMPTLMANLWLSTGGAIIVALLIAAALLPRPSAEIAISQLPITLGSPQQEASNMAPLDDDGARDDQGKAAERKPETGEQADQPPPEGSGNQRGGKSEGQASGDAKGEVQGQGEGESKQSGGEGKPSAEARGEASNKQRDTGAQGESKGQSEQKSSQESPGESESASKDQQDSQAKKQKSDQPPKSEFARNMKKYREAQKELAEPYEDKQKQEEKQAAGDNEQQQSPEESPAESAAAESMPVPEPVETAAGWLMTLVKWVFYGLFLLGVLWALWRYRHEVLAAIRSFLDELSAWWQGLLGGKRNVGVAGDEERQILVPLAPFASYADPFASGLYRQSAPEELVRYSFEAFEAWSREHGCPRGADQTPHELARDVARLNTRIAADARNLAELYARAAFSRGALPAATREQLRRLWSQMLSRDSAPIG